MQSDLGSTRALACSDRRLAGRHGRAIWSLNTASGQMVRTAVKDISVIGRNTQGVKLVNLDPGDKLQAVAPVISEGEEDAAGNEEAPASPQ